MDSQQFQIIPMSFPRRSRYAQKAQPALEEFLAVALGETDVFGQQSHACQKAWGTWTRAQALDMYADAGMEALAWGNTLVEALYMLEKLGFDGPFEGVHSVLSKKATDQPLLGEPRQGKTQTPNNLLGFERQEAPSVKPMSTKALLAKKRGEKQEPTPTELLTMPFVERAMQEWDDQEIWSITQKIFQKTNANLPTLSLLVQAWLVLDSATLVTGWGEFLVGGYTLAVKEEIIA